MRLTRERLRVGFVCLLAAACQPEIDLEAERAALFHADESWAAAVEAEDVERVFTFWTDDAVIYPPVGPAIEGIEAIREFVRQSREQEGFAIGWSPTGAEVSSTADVGYTFGAWERTAPGPDGTLASSAGTYVSIWRKQPDGTWRCSVEISQLGRLPNLGGPPSPGELPAQ
jgi:ketosteroid isomerase-like protein